MVSALFGVGFGPVTEQRGSSEDSHHRCGPRPQELPGRVVREQRSLDRLGQRLGIAAARWPTPQAEAAQRPSHRVVDRDPGVHDVVETLGAAVHMSGPVELAPAFLAEPQRVVGEPARRGGVEQGGDHLKSGLLRRSQQVQVPIEGVTVDAARLRFEPGPLDGQPDVGQPDRGQDGEVVVMVRGEAIAVPRSRHAAVALPAGPVGRRSDPFGLQRTHGHAPERAGGGWLGHTVIEAAPDRFATGR